MVDISRLIVGVDIAKRVFQLYWVEKDTGEEMNVRLSRAKFLNHFANRAPCLVAMEACGGSQHWARRLTYAAGLGATNSMQPLPELSTTAFS